MMAVNDFAPVDDMPEPVPMDEDHPFVDVKDKGVAGGGSGGAGGELGGEDDDRDLQKKFLARMKEKKEWQEPQVIQDADEVFKEVKK